MITENELGALVGHRFPGGHYRIAHWENWLLTDCTGRAPMPDDLAHPIVLFHAPILGAGTSQRSISDSGTLVDRRPNLHPTPHCVVRSTGTRRRPGGGRRAGDGT